MNLLETFPKGTRHEWTPLIARSLFFVYPKYQGQDAGKRPRYLTAAKPLAMTSSHALVRGKTLSHTLSGRSIPNFLREVEQPRRRGQKSRKLVCCACFESDRCRTHRPSSYSYAFRCLPQCLALYWPPMKLSRAGVNTPRGSSRPGVDASLERKSVATTPLCLRQCRRRRSLEDCERQ